MKTLKIITALLFIVAFTLSCEKETIQEDSEMTMDKPMIFTDFINSGIDLENHFRESELNQPDPSTLQSTLESCCSGLPVEDFEEGIGGTQNFYGPLNQYTDNSIFSPGDILPGISISSDYVGNQPDLAFVINGWRGADSKLIIANRGNSSLILDFNSGNVNSVELDVHSFAFPSSSGNQVITIKVYGLYSLLQTSYLTATTIGVHHSISLTEPITKITMSSKNSNGWVGADNISFGFCGTDSDGDGCTDTDDPIPASNMEPTIILHGCDTGVQNNVTLACGIMMSDIIDGLEAGTYSNHGRFVRAVAHLTNTWLAQGLITQAEKGAIVSCAARSN